MRNLLLGMAILLTGAMLTGSATAQEEPPEKAAKKPTDAEIKKQLPGKWSIEFEPQPGVKVSGKTDVKEDGTMESDAVIKAGDQTIEITISGTWAVSDGVVTSKVTKSSRPEIIPVGHEVKDEVISINDKEYKYKSQESGQTMTEKRIKDDK